MLGGRQACWAVYSLYKREHSLEEEPLPKPATRSPRSGRHHGHPRMRVQPAPTPSVDKDDQAVVLHTGVGGTSPDSSDHEEAAIAIVGSSTSTTSGSTSSGVYLRGPS